MAFPATSQALSRAYAQIKGRALDVRSQSVALRAAAAAGPITGERVIGYSAFLNRARSELQALAATPGLAAYAQGEENNPALDIVAEYNAMVTQIDATIAWIVGNLPEDVSGYKLVLQLNAQGLLVWRTFDTTATAGFRAALDALIATIA